MHCLHAMPCFLFPIVDNLLTVLDFFVLPSMFHLLGVTFVPNAKIYFYVIMLHYQNMIAVSPQGGFPHKVPSPTWCLPPHGAFPHMVPSPTWCLPPHGAFGAFPRMVPFPTWCLSPHGAFPHMVPFPTWCLSPHGAFPHGAFPHMVPFPTWCLSPHGAFPHMVPFPTWCLSPHGAFPHMVPFPTWCLSPKQGTFFSNLRMTVSGLWLPKIHAMNMLFPINTNIQWTNSQVIEKLYA